MMAKAKQTLSQFKVQNRVRMYILMYIFLHIFINRSFILCNIYFSLLSANKSNYLYIRNV
jgi:hypothetical protein